MTSTAGICLLTEYVIMQISCGTMATLRLKLKDLHSIQDWVWSEHFFSHRDSLKLLIYSKKEEYSSWGWLLPGFLIKNCPVISSFWGSVWGCVCLWGRNNVHGAFVPCGGEVALATAHGLLNAKVNNSKRHAYAIILIISGCPQAVITYTPYFPNVSNLFLMSRIIS